MKRHNKIEYKGKSQDEIFALYGKVLKGDKQAKKELIEIYKPVFPHNKFLWENPDKQSMHTMYLHLFKVSS